MKEQRFLQTEFWAYFKGNHGWKPCFFLWDSSTLRQVQSFAEYKNITDKKNSNEENIFLSVLIRSFSVAFKKFSIAYVPMAPEYEKQFSEQEYLKELEKGKKINLPNKIKNIKVKKNETIKLSKFGRSFIDFFTGDIL